MSQQDPNAIEQPRSESQAEDVLTGLPLSAGYRPSMANAILYAGASGVDGRFDYRAVLYDIEWMLMHPDILLPYSIYTSIISSCKFQVKAQTTEQAEFVWRLYAEMLWPNHLEQLQYHWDYGWGGYEPRYKIMGGWLQLAGLDDLHPLDCWVITRAGQYQGFRLKASVADFNGSGFPGRKPGAIGLWGPGKWPAKGIWLAHNRRWHKWYGRSQLYGAWRPWRRLATRDGAEEVIDGGFYRGAYQGPLVRYPPEDFRKGTSTSDVDFDSARAAAREIAELAKAGASFALPNTKDSKGDYKWQIEWAKNGIDISPWLQYEDNLQKQCARGVGTPPELFEASDTGSGWSGRVIPLLGMYQTQTKNARSLVRQTKVQLAEPLLQWNYGRDAWCEVTPVVELPEALQGQPGGKESASVPAGVPGQQAPGTGQKPQGTAPQDGGGGLDQLMQAAGGGGGGAEMSTLDPEIYPPDEWELWSVPVEFDLAGPGEGQSRYVQRQITRGPRKGQTGWFDTKANAGKGKWMPSAWRPAEQRPPKEKAGQGKGEKQPGGEQKPGKGRAAPKGQRPSVDEAHQAIAELTSNPEKITSESILATTDRLMALTVKDIGELKKRLQVKASGAKAELVGKIVERALGGKGAPPKPPPAPESPPAGASPKGDQAPPPPAPSPPAPPRPALPPEEQATAQRIHSWLDGKAEMSPRQLYAALLDLTQSRGTDEIAGTLGVSRADLRAEQEIFRRDHPTMGMPPDLHLLNDILLNRHRVASIPKASGPHAHMENRLSAELWSRDDLDQQKYKAILDRAARELPPVQRKEFLDHAGMTWLPAGYTPPKGADNAPNMKLPWGSRPELSRDEAVAATTYGAVGYKYVNQSLYRDKSPTFAVGGYFAAALSKLLAAGGHAQSPGAIHKNLKAAFGKAQPFEKPVTVHRGLNFKGDAKKAQGYVKQFIEAGAGGVVRLKGYQSTSTHHASSFDGEVQFTIEARHGLDIKPYGEHPGEDELLLNHDSTYRVGAVEKTARGWHIRLEQLTWGT